MYWIFRGGKIDRNEFIIIIYVFIFCSRQNLDCSQPPGVVIGNPLWVLLLLLLVIRSVLNGAFCLCLRTRVYTLW